jgi:hypothetical protein
MTKNALPAEVALSLAPRSKPRNEIVRIVGKTALIAYLPRSYLNRRVRARFPPPVVTVTRFIMISIVS